MKASVKFSNGWLLDVIEFQINKHVLRGYVLDGCYWFEHDNETEVFNVHLPMIPKPVNWDVVDVVHKDVRLVSFEFI